MECAGIKKDCIKHELGSIVIMLCCFKSANIPIITLFSREIIDCASKKTLGVFQTDKIFIAIFHKKIVPLSTLKRIDFDILKDLQKIFLCVYYIKLKSIVNSQIKKIFQKIQFEKWKSKLNFKNRFQKWNWIIFKNNSFLKMKIKK